ncbi:MAG: DUF4278 domain-containing protein [Symploca sp. SIO2E9]|nr:DUF4278 domain-containing protein [Symploca sp. SIO2E9]
MKFTYRGISYESNLPTLEMIESKIIGKYRSVDFKIRRLKPILVPHSTLRLKYRGVTHLAFGHSWYPYYVDNLTPKGK